ncbi:hypothetical protein G432_08630 [Sphingomonas sp. MM-1]|nr:hypothetical protein G432_08630 [Sphingomonas sp. MM-1]
MSAGGDRLKFELRPHSSERRSTTCALMILIDGEPAWPVPGETEALVEIQIDDLLAHLTDFWKPLMLRQVYPIDAAPSRPSTLRSIAEAEWEHMQPEAAAAEDEAITRFEEAHDLSHAFAGLYGLPPFWMMRSGEDYILESSRALWRLPFDDVRASLNATGDWICARLHEADAERWQDAIAAWQERDAGDAAGLLAWSTGLDRDLATSLLKEGALEPPQNFNDAANDNDELRIAARMAGALPADQIREIIGLARQFAGHEAEALKALAADAQAMIAERFPHAKPFEQGEAAARFVRERLSITADRAVKVFEMATSLGIELRHNPAEPPSLDGLAIWGPRHGPGVFLNEASGRILGRDDRDVEASLGARVTMAHELCHLLLDGEHALSAIEVLKARMPAGVEQRAKSFAGEFLVPTDIAAEFWHRAKRPVDRAGLDAVVRELIEIYEVTRSVAAWKVEHAARRHAVDLSATLDSVAPHR